MKHMIKIIRNFFLYTLLLLLFGFFFHAFFHLHFQFLAFFTDPVFLAAELTFLLVSILLELGLPALRRWWLER